MVVYFINYTLKLFVEIILAIYYIILYYIPVLVIEEYDFLICFLYKKVVLQNNESMKSKPSMQSYEAPAGRKYILQY